MCFYYFRECTWIGNWNRLSLFLLLFSQKATDGREKEISHWDSVWTRKEKQSVYTTQRKHAQKNIILMVCLNMMFSLFFKNVQSGRYIQLCSQVWARLVKLHISFQAKAIRGHWQVRGGYSVFHKLVRSLLKHSAWLHTAFCPAVVCTVTCAAGSAESE